MLKGLVAAAIVCVSTVALADQPTRVAGHIAYQMPDGSLAEREVAIEMTRSADGTARFTLHAGDMSIPATEAFMRDSRGSRLAYVAFPNAFTASDGTVSHLLFKGWKLGDDAAMLYQGTAFKTTAAELANGGETLEECVDRIRQTGELDDNWTFAGAFRFSQR